MTYHSPIAPLSAGDSIAGITLGGLVHQSPLTLRYAINGASGTYVEFAPAGIAKRGPDGLLQASGTSQRGALDGACDAFISAEFNARKKADCGDFDLNGEPASANETAYYASDLGEGHFLSEVKRRIHASPPEDMRALLLSLCTQLQRALASNIHHGAIAAERVFLPETGTARLIGYGHRAVADMLDIALPSTNGLGGEAGDVYGLSELGYTLITGHTPPPYALRQTALADGADDPLVPAGEYADAAAHGALIRAISRGLSLSGNPEKKTLEDWAFTVEGRSRLMADGANDTPAPDAPASASMAAQAGASTGPRPLRPAQPMRPKRGAVTSTSAQPAPLRNVLVLLAGLAVLSVLALYANKAGLFERTDDAPVAEITKPEAVGPSAEDERAWVNARTIDSIASYDAYLARFPEGYYAAQARTRLDALDDTAWQAAITQNTLEGFRAYIEAFPLGLHVPEAQQIIDRLEAGIAAIAAADEASWNDARRRDSVAAYDGYLSAYPDGQFVEEAKKRRNEVQEDARDDEAFKAAENIGTKMAYQSYLNRFPRGKHASKALAMLDRLTTRNGDVLKDCAQCPNMVVVGSGTFQMGSGIDDRLAKPSEKPQHTVTIPTAFALGQSEVTVGQWRACAGAGACKYDPKQGRDDAAPVLHVSWDDAAAYAGWLAKTTGKAYRLPSEAEWEYAARAGETAVYAGGRESSICRTANIAGVETKYPWKSTACDDGVATGVEAVSRRQPNAFGLYDMIGNAAEWTRDCATLNYRDAPTSGEANERGLCSSRIARGGSWISGPRDFRLAARMVRNKSDTDDTTGFRVALTLSK